MTNAIFQDMLHTIYATFGRSVPSQDIRDVLYGRVAEIPDEAAPARLHARSGAARLPVHAPGLSGRPGEFRPGQRPALPVARRAGHGVAAGRNARGRGHAAPNRARRPSAGGPGVCFTLKTRIARTAGGQAACPRGRGNPKNFPQFCGPMHSLCPTYCETPNVVFPKRYKP